MTVEVFQRGESVPCWAENKNWAGSHFNPTQGIKITLYKPDGTLAQDQAEPPVDIDDTAMGKETTPRDGIYVFYYSSATDDPVGWWHYFCKAVDGSGDDAKTVITHGSFKLT